MVFLFLASTGASQGCVTALYCSARRFFLCDGCHFGFLISMYKVMFVGDRRIQMILNVRIRLLFLPALYLLFPTLFFESAETGVHGLPARG